MKVAIIRKDQLTKEIEITKETSKKILVGGALSLGTISAMYGYQIYKASQVIEAFICR